MHKKILFLLIPLLLAGCSGKIDTTNLNAEEHLKYAMELFLDESYEQSVNEFQAILLQHPGSSATDDAQYFLGMSYYTRKQFILAAYEFSKLIRDIPASEFVHQAQFMLAESYYQLSPDITLDQRYTKQAIKEFQAFIDFFPANPKVPEAEVKIRELNGKLAEKEYNTAVIYEKMDYTLAAISYYAKVVENYHDTEFAPEALYRKIRLLVQKERRQDAVRDIAAFLQRYPDDPKAREITELQEKLVGNI